MHPSAAHFPPFSVFFLMHLLSDHLLNLRGRVCICSIISSSRYSLSLIDHLHTLHTSLSYLAAWGLGYLSHSFLHSSSSSHSFKWATRRCLGHRRLSAFTFLALWSEVFVKTTHRFVIEGQTNTHLTTYPQQPRMNWIMGPCGRVWWGGICFTLYHYSCQRTHTKGGANLDRPDIRRVRHTSDRSHLII